MTQHPVGPSCDERTHLVGDGMQGEVGGVRRELGRSLTRERPDMPRSGNWWLEPLGVDGLGELRRFPDPQPGRVMMAAATKEPLMAALPDAAASVRLGRFTLVLLVLNVLATIIAVAVNLPAQFGGVGTDAGAEFLTRGTAISAPLLPVVLTLLVVLLAPRRDRWSWVGIALAYLTAVMVGMGGIGEMLAEPTVDTSRAVLITGGIAWLAVAAVLFALATAAVGRARRTTTAPA